MAGGLVLVWLAAVTVCSAHCSEDSCHCDSIKIEQTATSNGQPHDSDNDDHSFCLSLHHLTPTTPTAYWVAPDFKLALMLSFHSTAQALTIEPLEGQILCQPPDREFVFTPEVSLGAAFRSLAPPAFV